MRWFVGLFAAVSAVLLVPALVSGHADYESSTPARDEVVPEPPERVDVFFTQELFKQEGDNFVRVFDESANQVSEGDGIVDDDDRTHMFATLQPDLPPGRYIVQWMTTSDADGDTDEGAFCFYVVVEPSPAQQAECDAFDEDGEEPTATGSGATEEPGTTEATATTPGEATPTPSANGGDEDDDGVPAAAIAGGVIGGIAAVIIVGGIVFFLRRTLA